MKKIFLALSLIVFVGTVGTTVYAATSNVKTEITKHDDKKKKKKSKKSCTADKAACSSKSAEGTTQKSCCAHKK